MRVQGWILLRLCVDSGREGDKVKLKDFRGCGGSLAGSQTI